MNMNLDMYLGHAPKDFVADYYYKIVDFSKDYEKITKKKMIEEIKEFYSNSEIIISICTIKELEILKEMINGKYEFVPNHYFYLCSLADKLLIYLSPIITIMDDFKKVITNALKKVDWNKKQEEDKIDALAIGYIKVMGSIYDKVLYQFLSQMLEISEEKIMKYLNNSELFKYHVGLCQKYMPSLGKWVNEYYYRDYQDYLDELDEQRKEYAKSAGKMIDLNDYINIFFNKVNVNNPKVKKMFTELSKNHNFPLILDQINLTVLLNEDYDIFLESMKILLEDDYTEENLKIMKEAMDEMPSGALNGLTHNEWEKANDEEIELHKKNPNEHQANAHLNKKECDLFYKLYMALIEYTNNTYHINENIKKIYHAKNIDPQILINIIDYLWENKEEIISDFISKNPYQFNNTELKLINEFKRGIRKNLIITKYERNYTLIYDTKKDGIYRIKGLNCNIDEIMDPDELPMFIKTTLLPFKDNMVFDGIITHTPIKFGLDFDKMVYEKIRKEKYLKL